MEKKASKSVQPLKSYGATEVYVAVKLMKILFYRQGLKTSLSIILAEVYYK